MKSLSTSVNLQERRLYFPSLQRKEETLEKFVFPCTEKPNHSRPELPFSPSSPQHTRRCQARLLGLNPEVLHSRRHGMQALTAAWPPLKWHACIQCILIRHPGCDWQWYTWCILSLWLHYFSISRIGTVSFLSREDSSPTPIHGHAIQSTEK